MATTPTPGGDVYQRRIVQLIVETKGIEENTRRAAASLRTLDRSIALVRNALLSFGAFNIARGFLNIVDTGTRLNNLLGTVTESTDELVAVQDQLFKVAQNTRTSIEATTKLYVRLDVATKQLGVSQQDLLDAVEAVNLGLKLGGQTAAETNSAILQLGQAFASGRLQGDEFRAVLENAPVLAERLSEALNTTVGGLRAMSRAGALTTETLFPALLKILPDLREEFENFAATGAEAFVLLQNQAIRAFDELNRNINILGSVSAAVKFLADNMRTLLDILSAVVVAFGAFKLASFAAALSAAAVQAGGLAAALRGMAAALPGLPALLALVAGAVIELSLNLETTEQKLLSLLDTIRGLNLQELGEALTVRRQERAALFESFSFADAKRIKVLDDEIALISQRIRLLRAQRAEQEKINRLGAVDPELEASLKRQNDLSRELTDLTRDQVFEEQKREALLRGNITGYEEIVRLQDVQNDLIKQRKDIEKELEITLTDAEVKNLRERLDTISKLEAANDQMLDKLKEGEKDAAAAAKKALKDRKEAVDDLIEALARGGTPLIDAREQRRLVEEQLALARRQRGSVDELGDALDKLTTKQKVLADVSEIITSRQEAGLPVSNTLRKNLIAEKTAAEEAALALQKLIEQRNLLQQTAERVDPRLGIQRQLTELQRALSAEGTTLSPEQFEAATKAARELEFALTGIAHAAAELQDIGNPFADLLAGIADFTKVFSGNVEKTSDQISALGQGSLQVLSFIDDQARALGIESFQFYKAMAVARATISAALAINALFAEETLPFAVKLGLAGLVAGLTGAQIAVIQAQEAPGRQFGGVVTAGRQYRVGEGGPEVFTGASGRQVMIPSEQGKITPVGSAGITIINQGPPLEVKDEQRLDNGQVIIIVDMAVRATEDRFSESLRTGRGKFSQALTSNTDTKRRF